MIEQASSKWLTDSKQIPEASNESLKQSLITCDGKGKEFKEAALEELLKRKYNDAVLDVEEK